MIKARFDHLLSLTPLSILTPRLVTNGFTYGCRESWVKEGGTAGSVGSKQPEFSFTFNLDSKVQS